ncbi:cyclin-D6-1-like [Typha latifolia]|uniref:cyclin-D6-1-like n=1 Tax=Typha latifolia TaxID=4733 RepID=UPI003C2FE187
MVTGIDALDLAFRRDSVDVIHQTQSSRIVNQTVAYLAINYLDRFLSLLGSPSQEEWVPGFVAVACLSIASKMKREGFSLAQLQRRMRFEFKPEWIARMEKLILYALEWRTRAITPFAFVRYFLSFFSPADPTFLLTLQDRSAATFVDAQNGMKFLEFSPSVVAAAALLSAAFECFPFQFPAFRSAISECPFINEEKLTDCLNKMTDNLASTSKGSEPSFGTPVTVLALQSAGGLTSSDDLKDSQTADRQI